MFAATCDSYFDAGISIIPVRGKRVCTPGFGSYSHRLANHRERSLWKRKHQSSNIGLMMGPINKVMGIDIDTDDARVVDAIESITGGTPCAKFGSKGKTMFFKSHLYKNEMMFTESDGCVLEFLCTSKQTVIPPSNHPKTNKPYHWIGSNIIDSISSLPLIKEDQLSEIRCFMESKYEIIDILEYRRRLEQKHARR